MDPNVDISTDHHKMCSHSPADKCCTYGQWNKYCIPTVTHGMCTKGEENGLGRCTQSKNTMFSTLTGIVLILVRYDALMDTQQDGIWEDLGLLIVVISTTNYSSHQSPITEPQNNYEYIVELGCHFRIHKKMINHSTCPGLTGPREERLRKPIELYDTWMAWTK